jgi:hypothetical protein
MFNVSFAGRVHFNPNIKIKNARASQIADAINRGFKKGSNDLGRKVKPLRSISGKNLMDINYDCFNKKTGTLNEKGIEGFNSIYPRAINITTESKISDYIEAIRTFVKKYTDPDGLLCMLFDQIQK